MKLYAYKTPLYNLQRDGIIPLEISEKIVHLDREYQNKDDSMAERVFIDESIYARAPEFDIGFPTCFCDKTP